MSFALFGVNMYITSQDALGDRAPIIVPHYATGSCNVSFIMERAGHMGCR